MAMYIKSKNVYLAGCIKSKNDIITSNSMFLSERILCTCVQRNVDNNFQCCVVYNRKKLETIYMCEIRVISGDINNTIEQYVTVEENKVDL